MAESDALPSMSPEEHAAYRAARERGRRAAAEGRIVNGNEVLTWLDALAAGRDVKAPEPAPIVSRRAVP